MTGKVETTGGERILVYPHGHNRVTLVIDDPHFGRVATVSVDPARAIDLADALDAACRPHRAPS